METYNNEVEEKTVEVYNERFTAGEIAKLLKAHLYLTKHCGYKGRNVPRGENEKLWEGVIRLTGSRRSEKVIEYTLNNWKRANRTKWEAMLRSVERGPEGYFKELVSPNASPTTHHRC